MNFLKTHLMLRNRNLHRLPPYVLFALAAFATSANAQLRLDVSAHLGYVSAGLVSADGAGFPSIDRSATDSTFAAVTTEGDASPAARWWSLGANADVSGTMNTSVSAVAEGVGTATAAWHANFRNDSGVTQAYDMNVLLSGGSFTFSALGATASRDFRAGFVADVSVNGTSVWSSAQTFSFAGPSSFTVTKTGFDVGDAVRTDNLSDGVYVSTYFDLADYSGKVSLGSFANAAVIDVVYSISSFAHWNDRNACNGECAGVSAQMNDPFDITSTGGGPRIELGIATAVPEPASAALLLGGLVGVVAWAGRRQAR